MRRYRAESFKTSGGDCIQVRICRAPRTPATVSNTPLRILSSMAVWTVLLSSSSSRAP